MQKEGEAETQHIVGRRERERARERERESAKDRERGERLQYTARPKLTQDSRKLHIFY